MSSDPGVPYIGSRISLTSKSAIRYEGTLYTIDTNESTVALKDVQSFGTENRPRAGGYVPPSSEIYEFVIFRGPDIAELNVINTAEASENKSNTFPSDPAIVASSPKPSVTVNNATVRQGAPPPPASSASSGSATVTPGLSVSPAASVGSTPAAANSMQGSNAGEMPASASQTRQSPLRAPVPTARPWGPPPSATTSAGPASDVASGKALTDSLKDLSDISEKRPVANGSHNVAERSQDQGTVRQTQSQPRPSNNPTPYRRRQRGENSRRTTGIDIPKEDFDFEAMNEKFNKASLVTGTAEGDGPVDTDDSSVVFEPKYNKSMSFFDNLELPPRDRSTPSERNQRRLADFETFGEHFHRRGHGRRRGRGGRGGRTRRGGLGSRGNSRVASEDV